MRFTLFLGTVRRTPLRSRRRSAAAGLLGLATLVAAATWGLALPAARAIYCDKLAPLAALAALLIALCFRALAGGGNRRLLLVALALAAFSLFASARFVARYHGVCSTLEQQLQTAPASR